MKKIENSVRLLSTTKRNKIIAIAVALLVVIASFTIAITQASGFFVATSPSQWTPTSNAKFVTEADGSKSLQFNAPAAPPPPTTPPVTGWPTRDTVGARPGSTSITISGPTIDDVSYFKNNNWPGSGTASDPYVIDKVTFTSQVTLGNWDSSNLTGKWVKFVNCIFEGDPGYPTPGGSAGVFARDNAPFFIIEDSTISVGSRYDGRPQTSNGASNFGVFSYVPFQLRRSVVVGANILVGFETERSEKTGIVIEGNYMSDVYSSKDDHTDIINGNFHASHVVVRNNYLDGSRQNFGSESSSSSTVVTNGFGVYDDPTDSAAGIIENWTIDHNYITNCATLFLSTTSKSRFLDPFVLTNNTFGNYTLIPFAGRTPSIQSGNVDANNKALQF